MFLSESSIKRANRYEDVCEGGWSGAGRRDGEATITKQCWIRHCQKDTSWMFHPFVWKWAAVMYHGGTVRQTWATVVSDSQERTALLSLATGSEQEATCTFMHKSLLHALNECGPWWISSPDALSMRAALCITVPAQTERALSSISLFSAFLHWKPMEI